MGRSLARGVIVHFLKEHNKQRGTPPHDRPLVPIHLFIGRLPSPCTALPAGWPLLPSPCFRSLGAPQYTLSDIRGILIGAMNDETADEEIQSGEGEMCDGVGEVQRTLRAPSSKVARPWLGV